MRKFIAACNAKDSPSIIDYNIVDMFIERANSDLSKGVRHLHSNDGYMLLTEGEFKIASKRALKAGWIMTEEEHNYQSWYYKFEKLKGK